MRTITVFNFLSLNGYYKGVDNDISWHRHGQEESEYAGDAAQSPTQNVLLFGRVTYEMMASYWPTEAAMKTQPRVAEGMNAASKIVISKSMKNPSWSNTTILEEDLARGVRKLKSTPGNNITILGSGSIVKQLAAHSLIDQYTFMVDPVVLGAGTSIFEGLEGRLDLELIDSKAFKSGVMLLNYRPLDK